MMTRKEAIVDLAMAKNKYNNTVALCVAIDAITRLDRISVWLDPDADPELALERSRDIVWNGRMEVCDGEIK